MEAAQTTVHTESAAAPPPVPPHPHQESHHAQSHVAPALPPRSQQRPSVNGLPSSASSASSASSMVAPPAASSAGAAASNVIADDYVLVPDDAELSRDLDHSDPATAEFLKRQGTRLLRDVAFEALVSAHQKQAAAAAAVASPAASEAERNAVLDGDVPADAARLLGWSDLIPPVQLTNAQLPLVLDDGLAALHDRLELEVFAQLQQATRFLRGADDWDPAPVDASADAAAVPIEHKPEVYEATLNVPSLVPSAADATTSEQSAAEHRLVTDRPHWDNVLAAHVQLEAQLNATIEEAHALASERTASFKATSDAMLAELKQRTTGFTLSANSLEGVAIGKFEEDAKAASAAARLALERIAAAKEAAVQTLVAEATAEYHVVEARVLGALDGRMRQQRDDARAAAQELIERAPPAQRAECDLQITHLAELEEKSFATARDELAAALAGVQATFAPRLAAEQLAEFESQRAAHVDAVNQAERSALEALAQQRRDLHARVVHHQGEAERRANELKAAHRSFIAHLAVETSERVLAIRAKQVALLPAESLNAKPEEATSDEVKSDAAAPVASTGEAAGEAAVASPASPVSPPPSSKSPVKFTKPTPPHAFDESQTHVAFEHTLRERLAALSAAGGDVSSADVDAEVAARVAPLAEKLAAVGVSLSLDCGFATLAARFSSASSETFTDPLARLAAHSAASNALWSRDERFAFATAVAVPPILRSFAPDAFKERLQLSAEVAASTAAIREKITASLAEARELVQTYVRDKEPIWLQQELRRKSSLAADAAPAGPPPPPAAVGPPPAPAERPPVPPAL